MAFLDPETEKEARTSLERVSRYLGSTLSSPLAMEPSESESAGVNAFADQEADAYRVGLNAASAGMNAYISRRQDDLYGKYAERMARINRNQQKAAAARANRGGLFGAIGKIGGTLLGGLAGPGGAAAGGSLGGALGSMFG